MKNEPAAFHAGTRRRSSNLQLASPPILISTSSCTT